MLKNCILSMLLMLLSYQFTFADSPPPNAIPGYYILEMEADMTYDEVADWLEVEYGATIVDGPLSSINAYYVYEEPTSDSEANFKSMGRGLGDIVESAQVSTQVYSLPPGFQFIDDDFIVGADYDYELDNHHNTIPLSGQWPGEITNQNNPCHDVFYQTNVKNQVVARVFDTGILPENHDLYSYYNYDVLNQFGWGENFINEDEPSEDFHGHGTAMTSIILNNFDETNSQSNLDIKTDKTHNEFAEGNLWTMMLALDNAITERVNVVNLSYNFTAPYNYRNWNLVPLNNLFNNVWTEGILCVVSAGNGNKNLDDYYEDSYYPAAYQHGNILTVGGMYCNKNKLAYSNYGSNSVDIFANGNRVKALGLEGQEMKLQGTAPATALVSAVALQLGSHLEEFDYDQVRCAIIEGALLGYGNIGPLCTSGGCVKIESALSILGNCSYSPVPPAPPTPPTQDRVTQVEAPEGVHHAYFDNRLQLDLETKSQQNVSVTVYNMMGQEVANAPAELIDGEVSISLEIPQEGPQAVYFARILIDNRMKTIKFFKHDLR